MAVKRWNGTAWEVYAGADVVPIKVTDGRPGKTTFIGATSPTGQVDGDIWIDQDTTTNAVVPTALTTKGDTFVATGNAAYTRLAAGNNGESLFADSSTSTGLRWQGDFNTGKNKILNGDFSIWQRGTTFSNPGGVYTADRWDLSYDGSGTTRSISRQAFAPGTSPSSTYQSKYFYRYSRSGGTGGTVDYPLRQRIEDVRTLSGQTVTVSFWAKADAARTFGLDFFQIFGTGGSGSVYVGVGSYAVTTSWQRFTTTVVMPNVVGKTINDIDSALLISYFCVSSNATWTLDLWGIQLEAGSVATEFTINTGNPQAELAACQRYYAKSYDVETAPGTDTNIGLIYSGFTMATTAGYLSYQVNFPVKMRNAPSFTTYDVADAIGKITRATPTAADQNGMSPSLAFNSQSSVLIQSPSGNAHSGLAFHWVASAEF